MKGLVLASGAAPCMPSVRRSARAPVARPFTSSRLAPAPARNVAANFFRFGKGGYSDDAELGASQKRTDYDNGDVEDYFNYMGFLATEGTYDRMEAMLATGMAPIDIILLLAASENDTPKIQEILKAGADPTVKGLDGKTPLEVVTKPELQALLKSALASKSGVAA